MALSVRPIPAAVLLLLLLANPVAGWSVAGSVANEKKLDKDAKKEDVHATHHGRVVEKGVQEQLEYVRGQLSAFLKARDEFSTMQEQVKDRFKSDENEIDRLVERQHHIKEYQKDAQTETAAIARQVSMLQAEGKIYAQKNETKEAEYVKQQVLDLQELTSTLQGSATELDEDQKSIDRITLEGKKLYAEMQKRDREQATIEAQLKVLEKQQARLEEKAEYSQEERHGETRGILDGEEEDEETGDYEAESAQALERAVGWNQDKLEEQATNAEDALRKGIGGGNMMRNIGSMMGAMHAMR